MKSLQRLRDEMSVVFDDLREGRITAAEAKELSNACGKIVKATNLEIEYAKQRKEKPYVMFIENGKEIEK